MKVRVSRRLPGVCFAAAMVFAPLAASAQNAPMMGGGHDHHMMGGGMMGGDMDPMAHMMGMMERMSHMMAMMHDKLAHASDRIASLKTRLKITEAQTPAWNKFADALLAAAKSAEESIETMHMQTLHTVASGLPEKLEFHAKMAGARAASLNAIKAALDPLYASFSDEQKKIADGLHIGSMGLM
jgi:LTXXQ motif family protein